MLTRSCLQVFIWRVPQDFSLYSDADEPADVSPIHKLSGHTRYVVPHDLLSYPTDTTPQ
jgi:hypothetical protein